MRWRGIIQSFSRVGGTCKLTVLFGHPGGNPNSHNAALAHLEAGWLETFCVPWMPSSFVLHSLEQIRPWASVANRLRRRRFSALETAPKVQGRLSEIRRLLLRLLGRGGEDLAYEANEWLMRTMARECDRPLVTAVHAYEDCSLWQFERAKSLGKVCIYDMPIGYYPAWERTRERLAGRYWDWLPAEQPPSSRVVHPEQKRREMNLADLVLVPSSFVESTIREFHPGKKIARAPYGVDLSFWRPLRGLSGEGPLQFIFVGQISLRKGIPLLLEAWKEAALSNAQLQLVGMWQLAPSKRLELPDSVVWHPPCGPKALRELYQAADVFVFPSFFDGFGLVLLEAMACGLPAIASWATAGPDVLTSSCGRLIPTEDMQALVDALRWFHQNRKSLPEMKRAARVRAELYTWDNYRRCVRQAVEPLMKEPHAGKGSSRLRKKRSPWRVCCDSTDGA